MTDTLSTHLDGALEAFEQHDEERALDLLVQTWRFIREERLARLIERLSDRLTSGLHLPDTAEVSLRASRRKMLDLPLLRGALQQALSLGHAAAVAHWLEQFREWPGSPQLQWPADPRLTFTLVDVAQHPVAATPMVAQPLLQLLESSADMRVLDRLQRLWRTPEAEPRDIEERKVQLRRTALLERIQAVHPRAPGPEATTRLEAWENALTQRETREATHAPLRGELLGRVFASPEDMSARLVLADHLQESGNPWGELVSAQLMPGASAERIEQLIEQHGLWWEAPLGPLVKRGSTRFERGFPMAVRLSTRVRQALAEPGPEWRTVREIDTLGISTPELARWLCHPNLANVTTLRRVAPELARALLRHAPPVRSLSLVGSLTQKDPTLLAQLAELPRLTHLVLHTTAPEDVQQCALSPLAPRLKRFEARAVDAWTLVLAPEREQPLRATLVHGQHVESLAQALRGAMTFRAPRVHIRGAHRTDPRGQGMLRAAVAPHPNVVWS
ncbi:hypothetical protein LZ198_25905 [Myxococcus sp. K15C18031901]|uniref:hypothetical protein n=1 Tax=Myxococcus dinghuensis TaxID=2906761 RepID=UPI0020A737E9|nr:hypothetical protein [Myxococcus dinghuensis]MCP3102310.1 hypothetical protein [Myxococcus dinghuensis]